MARDRGTDPLQAAFASAVRRFERRRDVTAIDIGLKIIDDSYTDVPAIRIHVVRKLSLRSLPQWKRFPRHINGVPVDVIAARYEDQNAVLQQRVDPALPGVSIGRMGSGTGTLGLAVTDNRRAGRAGFITAAHVLLSGGGSPGDIVLQPSAGDGGTGADKVGEVSRSHLDSDAILTVLDALKTVRPTTALTGLRLTTPRDPVREEVLEKVSRTTGIRRGRVEGIGNYMGLKDAFRLVGLDGTPIAENGDSGGIWYDPVTGEAVGLHCKGPALPSAGANFAVATKLTVVVRKLAVTPV